MLSEERKLDYVNTIKKFCLMDDVFMNAVFGDNLELTADLLKVILENDKINVVSSKAQYSIKNIAGHSAMLDIFAKDDQGGVKVMCELMQKLFDKEAEEIKHNERRQYAEVMLKDGVSLENAIKWSKLSREEVEAIAKQLKEKPVA